MSKERRQEAVAAWARYCTAFGTHPEQYRSARFPAFEAYVMDDELVRDVVQAMRTSKGTSAQNGCRK